MHSYFSWDFLRIFDNSTPYPSNKETISGYCAYPCNLWSTAESIISANGGQIDLKFTSDNLSQFRGFWLEYRLGKNPLIISCTSLLIFNIVFTLSYNDKFFFIFPQQFLQQNYMVEMHVNTTATSICRV